MKNRAKYFIPFLTSMLFFTHYSSTAYAYKVLINKGDTIMFSESDNEYKGRFSKLFNKNPYDNYIELEGFIMKEADDGGLNAVSIEVYRGTSLYLSTKSSYSGKNKIKLPLNDEYSIVFSKQGYVAKSISVNTLVPPNAKNVIYKVNYNLFLFEKIKDLHVSILSKPVAFISLNNFDRFDYDYRYTLDINRKVEKIYQDYYQFAIK